MSGLLAWNILRHCLAFVIPLYFAHPEEVIQRNSITEYWVSSCSVYMRTECARQWLSIFGPRTPGEPREVFTCLRLMFVSPYTVYNFVMACCNLLRAKINRFRSGTDWIYNWVWRLLLAFRRVCKIANGLYLSLLRKSGEKIRVSVKSGKTGTLH